AGDGRSGPVPGPCPGQCDLEATRSGGDILRNGCHGGRSRAPRSQDQEEEEGRGLRSLGHRPYQGWAPDLKRIAETSILVAHRSRGSNPTASRGDARTPRSGRNDDPARCPTKPRSGGKARRLTPPNNSECRALARVG